MLIRRKGDALYSAALSSFDLRRKEPNGHENRGKAQLMCSWKGAGCLCVKIYNDPLVLWINNPLFKNI